MGEGKGPGAPRPHPALQTCTGPPGESAPAGVWAGSWRARHSGPPGPPWHAVGSPWQWGTGTRGKNTTQLLHEPGGGSQHQAGRGEAGLGTGPHTPRTRKGSGAQPSCTPRAWVSARGRRPRMREERTALLLTEAPEINQRAAGGESAEILSHASRGLCQ